MEFQIALLLYRQNDVGEKKKKEKYQKAYTFNFFKIKGI